MKTRLLIIADDFTGALDTGVQFAKRGVDTIVTVMRGQPIDWSVSCKVLVVNTESRHDTPDEAYEKVASVVRSAKLAGFTHMYKKTDSTLRGNIGRELQAVLDAVRREAVRDDYVRDDEVKDGAIKEDADSDDAVSEHHFGQELVFVPAFPKSGRYTVRGVQYVWETPLAKTTFANDPFNPIRHSDVRAILTEQTTIPIDDVYEGAFERLASQAPAAKPSVTSVVQPAGTPAGTPAVAFAANNRLSEMPVIRVVDTQTDEDLQTIGQILKQAGKLTLLAGCAGFAEFLPDLLGLEQEIPLVQRAGGSTLLVSGSVNPMSLKQVHYAFEKCGYASSQLSVDQKIIPTHIDVTWEARLATQLVGSGKAAIWSKRAELEADDAAARAEQRGVPAEELAALIARNIGTIVKRTLEHAHIGTLIVFGGDTLLGIADQIGCHVMRPIREIVPGVALSQFVDSRFSLSVVSKAGGFGGEDVVGQIEDFLQNLTTE